MDIGKKPFKDQFVTLANSRELEKGGWEDGGDYTLKLYYQSN